MTARPGDASVQCQQVVQRLIACHEAGERPADDAVLAEHLGSCLGCFRAAADLREVPRLAALLRDAEDPTAALPDPGPAFWASFPSQLGQAFSQTFAAGARTEAGPTVDAGARALAPETRAAKRRTTDGPTPWQRFVAWVRMPVPAAMAGAACATAVALLMRPPPTIQTLGQRPLAAEVEPVESPLGSGQDDVAFAVSGSVYDSLHDMDARTLAHVRDSFGSDLDRVLAPVGSLATSSDDDLAATATAPDPGTVSEELDELDERSLSALRDRLGGGQ